MRRKHLSKTHFKINLNIFKILSIILIIAIVLSIPFVVKKSIKINKIICISQYGDCPEEIVNILKSFENRDYKLSKKLITDYLSSNLLVEDHLVQYKIPSTLKVEINLKKPKSAIYLISEQKYYLIGDNNIVLSVSDNTDLPRVVSDRTGIKIGEPISDIETNASEIITNLNYLYSIKEGVIEKNTLIVKSNENVNILFPLDGDTKLLIGSLRHIFSRLNDESEGIRMDEIREIDLRFKNSVLRKN